MVSLWQMSNFKVHGKLWGCLFLLMPGLLVLRVRSVQSSILSTRSTTSNSESCGLELRTFETLEGICAQVGSDGKSICLPCGRPKFNPWVRKIPRRRKWHPTPVLLPGKSHGWRSLVGYSPWGCRVGHDWVTSLHCFVYGVVPHQELRQ